RNRGGVQDVFAVRREASCLVGSRIGKRPDKDESTHAEVAHHTGNCANIPGVVRADENDASVAEHGRGLVTGRGRRPSWIARPDDWRGIWRPGVRRGRNYPD